jgi:ankyrin repeat domain-containing protein 50
MHLDDFALGLLSSLDYERRDHSARQRPIIFVCHSLGGLLFKQVLISGILAGPEYKDLVDSIRGVIFMGTPHRGSNSASYATILSKILNVPTFGRGVRSDLLTLLKTSSPILSQITQQSKNLLKPLSVISFYEQQPLGPTLIVEPFSAVLGLPNERTIPINRDHRQIAKVSPRNQQHFNIVKNVVMDLVNQCISEENTDMCKSLLDKLYCFDYRSTQLRPRQPHAETCKWLFQHETSHGWSIAEQSSLLVLSGPPGTGKSVLARHLVEQIESGSDDTPLADDFKVVSFFCSYDPSGATTAETVLRSILHQLLQLLPQAQTIVRNRLETRTGHSITIHTESNYVWRAIADVLAMKDGSKCIIVLDAIDELSANDGFSLLTGFSQTIQDINHLQPRHQVKVFLSARIDLEYLSETVEEIPIFTINLSTSPNYSGVEHYVKACIHDFEKECKAFADSVDHFDKQQIVNKISARASGMFLWAVVAWNSFIKGVLWNKEQVRKKLTQLDFNPAGIDELYEKMLERVPKDLRQDMWAVFRILVTAQRPLRDAEVSILLSLIMSDEVPSTSGDIDLVRNVSGSILRKFPEFVVQQSDGTLTFVHLSFNQYLKNLWTRKYPEWLNRAHCQMARSCLDYLELEDLIQHARTSLTQGEST